MSLLRRLVGNFRPSPPARPHGPRRRPRGTSFGAVERLETRELLATITVLNTNDSGTGSLRQAIQDANTLAGPDTIQFNIPVTDPGFVTPSGADCDSTNNNVPDANACWWRISLASPLPTITGNGTELRGFTQLNDTNPGVVGTVINVGTDAIPLPQKTRPEIAIDGNGFDGITVSGGATGIIIEGMAIYNAADGIVVTTGTTAQPAATISRMLIGVLPNGDRPDASERNANNGVEVHDLAQVTVVSSYVGHNGQGGIVGLANGSVLNLLFNEVFENGWSSDQHSGIEAAGIDSEILGNYVHHNRNSSGIASGTGGHGIELGPQSPGTGHINVENNTVESNVSAGIAIRGGSSGNTVGRNVITKNRVGVLVSNEGSGQTNNNTITRNSIFANANGGDGLGIDLASGTAATIGNGITLNDPGDADGGPNNLTNFPVLVDAVISGSNVVLTGFAEPGTLIEFFVAAPDGSGFGEGERFIVTRTEGSADDSDTTVGSYGPMVNGLAVATGAVAANRFTFTLPIASLPFAIPEDSVITATGTVAGNTSEFGPNAKLKVDKSSLSGVVFEDRDNDGVKDAGEDGIEDVEIILTGVNDRGESVRKQTHTDNRGRYSFDNLRPGVYQIDETQPVGFADGTDSVGNLGGERQKDRFIVVLESGQHGTNYNFGELATLPGTSEQHTIRFFPGTEQRVEVRILSQPWFDPQQIDVDSVRLGGAAVKKSRNRKDFNRDGTRDLLLFFDTKQTSVEVGDTTVRLLGRFQDGRTFAMDLRIESLAFESVKIRRRPRFS